MKFFRWLFSLFGGPSAPAPTIIVKAQAETVKLCGFLPAASTVAAIIGAMTGQGEAVATAMGVATTVCKAVSSVKVSSLMDMPPTAVVNGQVIVIEGEFVGK